MPDLTTRLLAEIERREGRADYRYRYGDSTHAEETLAYLGALREVVEIHAERTEPMHGPDIQACAADRHSWPCPTIAAVAEGLGVEA